jgi:hypothetical protein
MNQAHVNAVAKRLRERSGVDMHPGELYEVLDELHLVIVPPEPEPEHLTTTERRFLIEMLSARPRGRLRESTNKIIDGILTKLGNET